MTSATMAAGRSAFAIEDLDYHIIRGSMVTVFLFFAYAPLLGPQRATWFPGATEWTICALLFLGFWDRHLRALGAAGATVTFIGTVTIIPFFPNGWEQSAGGFPAMTLNTAFLMNVVLLAVSFYLLRQDLQRTDFFPPMSDQPSRRGDSNG
jgi:hypothetical protein